MASHIAGSTRLTIQALDLGPRGYAAVGSRYRAAQRALQRRALTGLRTAAAPHDLALTGGVVGMGLASVIVVLVALGAPAWLALVFAAAAFVPIAVAARRRPRQAVVERHSHAA